MTYFLKITRYIVVICRISTGATRDTRKARCIKLIKDMHYEAQVQCVINYGAMFLKQKIKKEVARNLKLTWEQYLQVNLYLYLD